MEKLNEKFIANDAIDVIKHIHSIGIPWPKYCGISLNVPMVNTTQIKMIEKTKNSYIIM